MYRKNLMRVCLAAIMAATVVTTSVPVYAAEPTATKQEKEAAETKTIYVSYVEEDGTPIPNAIEKVEVPKDAYNFKPSLLKNIPDGYELAVVGDIDCASDTINLAVRKKTPVAETKTIYVSYVEEDGTPIPNAIEKVEVPKDAYNFKPSLLKNIPDGYELAVVGDIDCASDTINLAVRKKTPVAETKTIYVSYVEEDGTPIPNAIEKVEVPKDAYNFKPSLLKNIPDGYELAVVGDIDCANDTINLTVRKKTVAEVKTTLNVKFVTKDGEEVKSEVVTSTVQGSSDDNWTFMLGTDFYLPDNYKLAEGEQTQFDVPFGATSAATIVVEKNVEEKTVYVSYIDEETKKPFKDGIEEIKLPADANSFNASILKKVPAGYEVCVTGDITFKGDTVNVEVRKAEKTVYVSYIDEETKKPFENGIEEIKLPADANSFNASILKKVPTGYEVCVTGDITFKGDTVNVEVRKAEKTVYVSYIDEETKKPFENGIEEIKLPADANSFNASILKKVPAGYEVCVTGDIAFEGDTVNVEVRKAEKTVYVSYIDEETKMPFENGIEEIKVAADANSFNTSILKKVPAGYEVCVTGDIAFEGDTVNVEVRKAEKTVYVSYIDEETKMPFENGIEEIKVAADANSFNTSILKKVPAGYELCVVGDVAFEGDTVNVEVRKTEKTVYVSYIDEETKMPFENGIEEIKLPADANSFNTSILKKVPAGYELCVVGDIAFEGDSLNVEVRKAERTVYVSYIDEETKIPFENGIEEIKVAKDATMFNTSLLKEVPEGYELCELGDVYIGENDTVNVEVRKLAAEEKTVYVSYIDEETKMPFENGIETIKLAKNATYFNTSLLKEVPEGYELCEVGDVYIGENDTVNVEVRKIKEEPETPVDPDKPVNPEKPEKPGKPVKPQEDDKDKDNQKDDKKDEDDKKSPKTSDEASPLAATATAGLSLAAILALLKKRR